MSKGECFRTKVGDAEEFSEVHQVTDYKTMLLVCYKKIILVCHFLHSHGLELLCPIVTIHEEIKSVRGINSQLCGVRKG